MFEVFLTAEQKGLLKEVRDFVKWVPRQLILDMDDEKIKFSKEFIEERSLQSCHRIELW